MNNKVVNRVIGENCWKIIFAITILLICIAHAFPAGQNGDFYPINGDFQNYNVVRRFLDGQIPYKDFCVYLGYGHVLLGSITTFLFGRGHITLMASKMAFQFWAIAALAIFTFTLFNSIFHKKDKTFSLLMTNILLLFVLVNPTIFSSGLVLTQDFYSAIQGALSTGNSARFLREIAPAFFVSTVLFLEYFLYKIRFLDRKRWVVWPIAIGIPTGVFVFYSNDYGFASSICAALVYVVVLIYKRISIAKKLKRIVLFCIIILISFVTFGEVITCGNLSAYLSDTFGAGGMQAWYYNSAKSLYLFDIDMSYYILIQALVAFVYFVLFLRNIDDKGARIRYGIPMFLNMTAYAAANEYKLLSGEQLHEVAYTILYITIIAEIIHFIEILIKALLNKALIRISSKVLYQFIVGVVLVYCVSIYYPIVYGKITQERQGTYINGVGYSNNLSSAIISANNFLGKDDVVFSTYASGLEASRSQYQPSGYDYIIHVLGDEAREAYLDSFHSDEIDFVTTIRENYTFYEYWVRNANWFFYRELYNEYQPVYANAYELFWSKKSEEISTINAEISSIEKLTGSSYKIVVKAPNIKYGIADICLNYDIEKNNSKMSALVFNTMLKVDNITALSVSEEEIDGYYYLDSTGKNSNIGITIVNGHGEIIISSLPSQYTSIKNLNVIAGKVYSRGVLNTSIVTSAWTDDMGTYLTIDNTRLNVILTTDIKEVKVAGDWYNCIAYNSNDGRSIILQLDSSVDSAFPIDVIIKNNNVIELH